MIQSIATTIAGLLMILPMPDIQSKVAEISKAARTPHVEPSKPTPPPSPVKLVQVTTAPQTVPQQIRSVFGPAGNKAVAVSWCESRFQTTARNGQFLGLFQMGARERARFGHGPDALTQIRAAYAYFKVSGFSPWKACA